MMATKLFMYSVLSALSTLLLCRALLAPSCPIGTFCPIDANCLDNTSLCVTVCPTENDIMQQGNHSTGNCERGQGLVS